MLTAQPRRKFARESFGALRDDETSDEDETREKKKTRKEKERGRETACAFARRVRKLDSSSLSERHNYISYRDCAFVRYLMSAFEITQRIFLEKKLSGNFSIIWLS